MGKAYSNAKVTQKMCEKRFENYESWRFPEAFDEAERYVTHPHNLLFYGDSGVGKTHLEAAICNRLREEHYEVAIFVSAPQLFMALEDAKSAFDKTRHLSILQQLAETKHLVIDDVDKAITDDKRQEIYFYIFDERSKAGLPTILSTNHEEELPLLLGYAAMSRFSYRLVSVQMIGVDYRLEE